METTLRPSAETIAVAPLLRPSQNEARRLYSSILPRKPFVVARTNITFRYRLGDTLVERPRLDSLVPRRRPPAAEVATVALGDTTYTTCPTGPRPRGVLFTARQATGVATTPASFPPYGEKTPTATDPQWDNVALGHGP